MIAPSKWRPIAETINSLPIDGSVDFLEYPTDRKSVSRFRCGVSVILPCLRFLVRTLPTGGLRAIKVGTWGSCFIGTVDFLSTTKHPVLVMRPMSANTIDNLRRGVGTFFLGFM